jgi:hypothetical protein
MSTPDPEDLESMLSDVRRVWPDSHTPTAKRDAFVAWDKAHKPHVNRLRAALAANVAWWLIKGREAGHDPDILDQVALQAVQWVIAVTARAMKARQGEPFEPARIAIVAYAMASAIAKAGGEPANLEGMAQEAEKIGAFAVSEADAEIARLRKLMTRLGDAVTHAADDLEDEEDRVYLGSTNHADTLREARDLYFAWRLEQAEKENAL